MDSGFEEAYFIGESNDLTINVVPYFIMAIVRTLISHEQGSLDSGKLCSFVDNFHLPQTSSFRRELVAEALGIPVSFPVPHGTITVLEPKRSQHGLRPDHLI